MGVFTMHAYSVLRKSFRACACAPFGHLSGYALRFLTAATLIFSLIGIGYAAEKSGIDSNAPLEHQAEIVIAQAAEEKAANNGPAELYLANCAACHQA
jgi:mono/diheme cytochrome c family protein